MSRIFCPLCVFERKRKENRGRKHACTWEGRFFMFRIKRRVAADGAVAPRCLFWHMSSLACFTKRENLVQISLFPWTTAICEMSSKFSFGGKKENLTWPHLTFKTTAFLLNCTVVNYSYVVYRFPSIIGPVSLESWPMYRIFNAPHDAGSRDFQLLHKNVSFWNKLWTLKIFCDSQRFCGKERLKFDKNAIVYYTCRGYIVSVSMF